MTAPWHGYRLVPEDVVFFRDGKPATMGEDHYLRSIFPPYPSTLYGLTRTQRLLEKGWDLSQVSQAWWNALPEDLRSEIGEWGGHGSLQLRGPWLVRGDDEILLPAPHDLLVMLTKDRAVTEVFRLLPEPRPEGQKWSHDMALMTPVRDSSDDPNQPEPAGGWFLTMAGIQRWMEGGVPLPEHFVDPANLWGLETRTGVGLNEKLRTSKTSMLYTFGFIRLKRGVSIGFELTGGKLQPEHHARLGGEGRLALLKEGPSLTEALAKLTRIGEAGATAALLTPGIFAKGSCPEIDVSAAVVAGMVHVGGWDLANRRPKPLYRAAPAGSVYYTDAPIEQLQSFSEHANEGFGLMLRGNQPRR
jgi:CRISPR-associated protein Cmr3